MSDARGPWRELAEIYDETRAFPGDGERIVPQALADRLHALGSRRVLELGSGTGRFTLPLVRAGVPVVGADRSAEMLARLVAKRRGEHLEVVRCEAERLPFSRVFDAVVFSHFLHLVESLDVLATELRRVLQPGAHVVLVDTSSAPRPTVMRVLAHVMPQLGDSWRPWPKGQDGSRDRALLRELLGHLGAEETAVFPCASLPSVHTLRRHLDDVRERIWSRFRTHTEEEARSAADAAERALLAEGADLDAPVEESLDIRLIVARLPEG